MDVIMNVIESSNCYHARMRAIRTLYARDADGIGMRASRDQTACAGVARRSGRPADEKCRAAVIQTGAAPLQLSSAGCSVVSAAGRRRRPVCQLLLPPFATARVRSQQNCFTCVLCGRVEDIKRSVNFPRASLHCYM